MKYYLWMHNGTVEGFRQIKRRLLKSLPDPLYQIIEGTTDSEHAFAVFLSLLGDTESLLSTMHLGQTLVKTVAQLEQWTAQAQTSSPSYYNFRYRWTQHCRIAVRLRSKAGADFTLLLPF